MGISRIRGGTLAGIAGVAIAALVLVQTVGPAQAEKDKKKPAIKSEAEGQYIRANFKLLTHQIYENYYQAGVTLKKKDYALSDAFLTVMMFYVDQLEANFPGVDYEGEPIDKAKFSATVAQLKKEMAELQAQVKAKKAQSMDDPEKALASTCLLCHDSVVFSSKARPVP